MASGVLDRQYALLDGRLGDFLRPALWKISGDRQVYLTSLITGVLGLGPAATVSGEPPDLHHCRGSFGGKDVIPLWRDEAHTQANVTEGLLSALEPSLGTVAAEDFFAYCYAVLASPAYVETFSEELTIPGPRIPITKERRLFARAVELGRRLVWLHTYGERFSGDSQRRGRIRQGLARCRRGIPDRAGVYPETFLYDEETQTLRIGEGVFAPVSKAVWEFSVSGFEVVKSWLSYRMQDGAGRTSSPLDEIRPERWTAEMTQELLELLWVLEATVSMFPEIEEALGAIVAGPTFHADELPQPTIRERQAPGEERQAEQQEMDF